MSDDIVPLESDRLPDGVVDLAGYRIRRGHSKTAPWDRCQHRHLIFDERDRRVRCEDCSRDLEHFDAFMLMYNGFSKMLEEAKSRLAAATTAKQHTLISRAAKKVDEHWRGRSMAPCCPHCSKALLPEDITERGLSAVNMEMERARRRRNT